MQALTATQLEGVWAAIPTPFTIDGSLDVPALEENIRRYQCWGVSAVYTTDSDGEFYALEIDEFQRFARAFGRAMEGSGMHGAMGVTWANTQGVIDRARAALEAGIPNLHVGFPFWMPLAPSDVPRFFDDLAKAVPQSRWIHYRTRRCHILPNGFDYAAWHKSYPEQLIGTKLTTNDISEISEIVAHAPSLAHFAGEYCFVAAALAGAQGLCSFWVNTLPEWMLETWRLCRDRLWEDAMERQLKLIRWETEFTRKLVDAGHDHGIIGKARGALTNFLVDTGITRPPYFPADRRLIALLKEKFDVFWADELARHTQIRTRWIDK